jgi:hypothetical protein
VSSIFNNDNSQELLIRPQLTPSMLSRSNPSHENAEETHCTATCSPMRETLSIENLREREGEITRTPVDDPDPTRRGSGARSSPRARGTRTGIPCEIAEMNRFAEF